MDIPYLSTHNNIKVSYCLYNRAHVLKPHKLAGHLLKCPDKPKKMKNCLFNNTHSFPISEIESHQMNCPDRYLMDQELYEFSNVTRPVINIINKPLINHSANGDDNGLWDEKILPTETSILETINNKDCAMKPVSGLTKSERKKYRSDLNSKFKDVDLSYNANEQTTNQVQEKCLFFGKKPDAKN